MKINTIELEGCDRVGKTTIAQYLNYLSDFKYTVHARGVISSSVYDIAYNRIRYDRPLDEHTLYVLIDADEDDLKIRFKITDEKYVPIAYHRELFNKAFDNLPNQVLWLKVNSSRMSSFDIANKILSTVEEINASEDEVE